MRTSTSHMTIDTMPRSDAARTTPDSLARTPGERILRWEVLLLIFLGIVVLTNIQLSPYFLDPYNLSDATFNFTEKAIVALAMTLLIIGGDIDLSVASIIALASTAMGAAAAAGAPLPVLIVVGPLVGLACGLLNGWLVTRFSVPAIIVTIGTMSLYRGISFIALGDQAYRTYPDGFDYFGQGYVFWVVSFEFFLFLVLTAAFGWVLHKTAFGRRIYAIGNNPTAALFSGIDVQRHRLILFSLVGLMSGLASLLLTSRLGSTRPNIATAWELEIITMVVLGGIAINGGAGTIPGVFIAAFLMGFLTFGMALLNIPGIVMTVLIGLLLILAIATPILIRRLTTGKRNT
jgi:rhamnose transport system permease protein